MLPLPLNITPFFSLSLVYLSVLLCNYLSASRSINHDSPQFSVVFCMHYCTATSHFISFHILIDSLFQYYPRVEFVWFQVLRLVWFGSDGYGYGYGYGSLADSNTPIHTEGNLSAQVYTIIDRHGWLTTVGWLVWLRGYCGYVVMQVCNGIYSILCAMMDMDGHTFDTQVVLGRHFFSRTRTMV